MNFNLKTSLFLLAILIFASCNRGVNSNHELSIMQDSTATEEINNPAYAYGIPVDSFRIIPGKIKRNAFLSDILLEYGVPIQKLDQVLSSSKAFDVRKVQPGSNYWVYCDRDSMKAKYFLYEHDQYTTYVFSFNDSLNITPFKKKVRTEIKYATGTINSSLWETMMDNDMPPALAVGLGEIFQWTVDFFGLQKGDHFKVIYEEKFIDERSVGTGKILTAQFTSSNVTYTAIPFVQNGTESYFDENGKSLRKAFLKAPLKFSRISSRYSTSRLHPVLKIRRPHLGVDYAAPIGTEVHSIGDGRVLSVTFGGGEGRMVKIKHNTTYTTAYMHLSRFGDGIKPGVMVRQGQVIGYVGSSGLSTGPHLDFRFYQNGSPIDPLKVIAPPSDPVTDQNMTEFNRVKEVNLSLLGTF